MSAPLRQAIPAASPGGGLDPTLLALARDYLGRRAEGDPTTPEQDRAWERFHDLLDPFLRRLARRRGGGHDPDDAAQEAWAELLGRIGRYRDRPGQGPCFHAWTAVVVRRRLARLAAREARRPAGPIAAASDLVDRAEDPADACRRAEDRSAVRAALAEIRDRVPEPSCRIAALRWAEGCTVAEIAGSLGLTPAQVRDRHRRALPALRSILLRRFDPARPPVASLSA